MASDLNALLLLLLRGLLPVRQTQPDETATKYFITDISAIALLQLQNIMLKRKEDDYDSP